MADAPADDIRLSKRVAQLAGCSRRQAELTIESGAVTVDGAVVDVPEHRVRADQTVAIQGATVAIESPPLTVVWHKPAGVGVNDWPAEWEAAWPRGQRRGLVCATALPPAAQGLVVITQHAGILRRLQDRQQPLESEYLIDAEGGAPDTVAATLKASHPALRASLNSHQGTQSRWRVVTKSVSADAIATALEAAGLQVVALRRQRLGRQALGPLAPGQWRVLDSHERF